MGSFDALALVEDPFWLDARRGVFLTGGGPNPNVRVTDITGAIVLSRTSGETPAFVQASASGIIATGGQVMTKQNIVIIGATVDPYDDFEYSWNFGDPNSAEWFWDPVLGRKVNSNSDQTGPEAVHCFRNPGSYTVTLTVRCKAVGGGWITRTFTANYNVTAFDASGGTFYLDRVNGNDAWSGTLPVPTPAVNPTDGPWQHFTNIQGYLGRKRLRFAEGSHWYSSEGDYIGGSQGVWADNLRWDSYVGLSGPGADPIIQSNSGTRPPWQFANGVAQDNIVVSNIKGISHVQWQVNYFWSQTNPVTNVYYDNCRTSFNFILISEGYSSKIGIWDANGDDPYTVGAAVGQINHVSAWFFCMGGYLTSASGGNPIYDHYIYPHCRQHSLYRWINFGPVTSGALGYCINTDCENSDEGMAGIRSPSDGTSIAYDTGAAAMVLTVGSDGSQGLFRVGQTCYGATINFSDGVQIVQVLDQGITAYVPRLGGNGYHIGARYKLSGNPAPAANTWVVANMGTEYTRYYLYDGCRFSGTYYGIDFGNSSNDAQSVQFRNVVVQKSSFVNLRNGLYGYCCSGLTARDNYIWGSAAGGMIWLNNVIWDPIGAQISYKIYRNHCHNNTLLALGGSSQSITATLPLQLTDNEVHDPRAAAVVAKITPDFADGSLVDANKWYAPNRADHLIFNDPTAFPNGTPFDFGAWRNLEYDLLGSTANPNFADPANGNFRIT